MESHNKPDPIKLPLLMSRAQSRDCQSNLGENQLSSQEGMRVICRSMPPYINPLIHESPAESKDEQCSAWGRILHVSTSPMSHSESFLFVCFKNNFLKAQKTHVLKLYTPSVGPIFISIYLQLNSTMVFSPRFIKHAQKNCYSKYLVLVLSCDYLFVNH